MGSLNKREKIFNIIFLTVIIILIIGLSFQLVKGQMTYKVVGDFDNCLNLTVKVTGKAGNFTSPYYFDTCPLNNVTWYCPCFGKQPFNLTLLSDNSSSRLFELEINYTSYQSFNSVSKAIVLDDRNTSINVFNVKNNDYCDRKVIEQVVYRDRYINVTQEVVIEKINERNITQYIENETRIKELQDDIKIYKVTQTLAIIIVFALLFLCIIFIKKRKK